MNHEAPNWTEEFQLVPHPDYPAPHGVAFTARAGRKKGALHLHFCQFGDEDDLLILVMPPGNGGRTDNLWQHTCFEAFVQTSECNGYTELNFSNWGEYAAYSFEGRRRGMHNLVSTSEPVAWLSYKGDRGNGVYERLFATLDLFDPAADWRIGLCVIIEAKDGTKSYWALAHAPGPPDFHNPDCWTARLPAPDAS